jgi:hypothetical protein
MTAYYEDSGVPLSEMWDYSDFEAELIFTKYMHGTLQLITNEDGGMLKEFGTIKSNNDVKPRIAYEHDYPTEMVCTLSGTSPRYLTLTGNVFGQTASLTYLRQIVRVGARLQYEDTDGTIYDASVTALDATNPIMTVTGANAGALPTNDTSMTWYIVAEPWNDVDDVSGNRSLAPKFANCTTQVFMEKFDIGWTIKNQKNRVVNDPVEHQLQGLMRKIYQSLCQSAINGRPVLSAGVPQSMLETNTPTLCGLMTWWMPELFGSGKEFYGTGEQWKNLGGVTLDPSHLNDLLAAITDAGGNVGDNIDIWVPPVIGRQVDDWGEEYTISEREDNTVGRHVTHFRSKEGGLHRVMRERVLRKRQIWVGDPTAVMGNWMSDDQLRRKPLDSRGRYDSCYITGQYQGMLLANPSQKMAGAYNIGS